jgi:transcriptional regulator with XRE-family HTH domain
MESQIDIEKLIQLGSITNDFELERAMIADRKLRLLAKDNSHFKNLRKQLRDLIEDYENRTWTDINSLTEERIAESDKYEHLAEQESLFLNNRKNIIKAKLKKLDLTQENLAQILGHKSKTHVSELMNGIKPFTLRDLIIINKILKIDFNMLIPNFITPEDQIKISKTITSLNKPKLKFEKERLLHS